MSGGDAILLDPADNVATALRAIEPGERVSIAGAGHVRSIEAAERIPIFHKLAVKQLPGGSDVVKYGEIIGMLTADAGEGALVHVHNLRSRRAGADLATVDTQPP